MLPLEREQIASRSAPFKHTCADSGNDFATKLGVNCSDWPQCLQDELWPSRLKLQPWPIKGKIVHFWDNLFSVSIYLTDVNPTPAHVVRHFTWRRDSMTSCTIGRPKAPVLPLPVSLPNGWINFQVSRQIYAQRLCLIFWENHHIIIAYLCGFFLTLEFSALTCSHHHVSTAQN